MKAGVACLLAFAAGLSSATAADAVRTRYLLLDDRVVDKTENAKLAVGIVKKHDRNPLFAEDKPWEKRFDNLYGNVIYDGEEKRYKCWYSPFLVDHSSKGMALEERKKRYRPPRGREMGICYATSEDGIVWQKPALGLAEYEGGRENNIILRGPHGAGIFKDLRDPDPKRRYKMLYKGLWVSFSADGIRWGDRSKCEGVRVRGDTHNNAFWAPTLGKYVAMTRTWGKRGRQVARMESDDFVRWTDAEVVLEGIEKKYQTYAMPVFFHGGVYLGLVAIHEQGADRVWTELAWSPDTRAWHRINPGTPLIPCSDRELDYDYGCVYPCATPVFLEDEIRLYYGGSDWLHTSWRNGFLCLASLRPDGFAGYEPEAAGKPAVVTTIPIPRAKPSIRITADVKEGGFVLVRVLDKAGMELVSAQPVVRTVTDGRLILGGPVAADPLRLRFELAGAKLYSFRMGD